MKKHYNIFTSKNGEKYVQTKNKYLAHALVFCGFKFMTFQEKDGEVKIYSFTYSEELISMMNNIIEMRAIILNN